MAVGLGSASGMLVGFGVGEAAAAALAPAFEVPKQDAWSRNPHRILNLGDLARLVAEGGVPLDAAVAEAERDGYDRSRVAALAYLAQTVPGVPEALDLWRRGLIGEPAFRHALVKAGLDQRYHDAIAGTKTTRRLDPAVVALAIVRGLIKDPGILPVGPPSEAGKVPSFPVFAVDAEAEALAAGYDLERLSVMVGNMGRPASPQEALAAYWRGAVERVDYERAIAEGDVRNEWRDAIEAASRAIDSPDQAAELVVRGWVDADAGAALAARHGMARADFDRLVELHGRPLSVHQVVTGLARGGDYPGRYENVPEPFRDAIRESSIREEWAELDFANRYNYPSPFVVRALVQGGELTPADAESIFLELGWKPSLAKKVADGLSKTSGGAGKHATATELADEYEAGFISGEEYRTDLAALGYTGHELELELNLGDARRVKRYRDKVVDAIAAAYTSFRLAEQAALAELAVVNVTGSTAQRLVDLWTLQRRDTIRSLTPAQIKKAHKNGLIDGPTALAELEWHDLTPADAATFLAE